MRTPGKGHSSKSGWHVPRLWGGSVPGVLERNRGSQEVGGEVRGNFAERS